MGRELLSSFQAKQEVSEGGEGLEWEDMFMFKRYIYIYSKYFGITVSTRPGEHQWRGNCSHPKGLIKSI